MEINQESSSAFDHHYSSSDNLHTRHHSWHSLHSVQLTTERRPWIASRLESWTGQSPLFCSKTIFGLTIKILFRCCLSHQLVLQYLNFGEFCFIGSHTINKIGLQLRCTFGHGINLSHELVHLIILGSKISLESVLRLLTWHIFGLELFLQCLICLPQLLCLSFHFNVRLALIRELFFEVFSIIFLVLKKIAGDYFTKLL